MRLKDPQFRPVVALAVAGALLFPPVAPAQQTDAELQKLATGTGNPFIDNAKAGYVFRTAYFDRRSSGDDDNTGNFRQRGMGLGGWLYANTGEIGDILSFGGTYNFVIPLHGPEDDSFNYILRDPGQDGVSVIGEANAKLRFGNHAFVVGRQSINQAWYLEDVVRFCGPQADPRPFLWASDAFVLPSFREGMPNALLEAMACGLPCIAPPSAGGDEVIEPETGLVPPSNEPADLLAELRALAGYPSRRAALGRSAAERAKEFDVERVVDQFEELYRSALAEA